MVEWCANANLGNVPFEVSFLSLIFLPLSRFLVTRGNNAIRGPVRETRLQVSKGLKCCAIAGQLTILSEL
jgi:hypothetical protein